MTKISGYAALASTQPDDVLPVVDVHDTSMASTGTTKKITVAALTAQTVSGFTAFATGGLLGGLNSTSGSNTVGIAGQTFYAALWIPFGVTLTGLMFTTGNVGGTDNWIGALYGAAGGAPLANSSLAGIAAPSANTKKAFPFTGTLAVTGPAVYFAGLQTSGATARFLGFPNAVEGFVTGSAGGVFGTLPSLVPGTSYSPNVGPFASTY